MKKQIFIIAAIFSLVLGTTAFASRPPKPGAGAVPKSAFPKFTEKKLKNGVTVVLVEDHRQPIVYFRTVVMSGSGLEGKSVGAASAVSSLLEKGTKTRNADQISQKLDYYGAEVRASASSDNINVFTSCLKKDIKDVLPIYLDLIHNPTFPKEELDKYKSKELSNLKSAKRNSSEPGRRLGREITYGDHPYGNYPIEADVEALTQQTLAQFHAAHFGGENILIGVVGDVTEAEIIPQLEKMTEDWSKGNRIQPTYPQLKETRGLNWYLIDRPNSVQSSIRLQRLGLSMTDPDFDKASFLDAIFAGNGIIGFGNRLFQNIREKHGYTYTPGGSLTQSLDRGVMVAVAEVRNAVTDSALDQMLYEYRRLSTEAVSAAELNFAKSLVTGKYLLELGDPQATAAKVLNIIQFGLPKDYYSTYPTRVQSFTAQDLLKVGQKVFPANDLNIIVTGTASQIMPKLDRFGKFTTLDVDMKPVKINVEMRPSPLSLDQIIEKLNEAYNKPAKDKLKSYELRGEIMMDVATNQLVGKYTEVAQADGKRHEGIEIATLGAKLEQRCNGTVIKEYQNGALSNVSEGQDLANSLSFDQFNKEFKLKGSNISTTVKGVVESKAGEVYVLELTSPGVAPELWYVNTKTFYVQRREQQTATDPLAIDYEDYRMVEGVPFSYKRYVGKGPVNMTVTITDAKLNINPDEKLFKVD